MSTRALALCLLMVGLLGACSRKATDPFEDVSAVPIQDRAALQACLSAPDLPGNHWPVDGAKAQCWLGLPQRPSLDEIAALLKTPDGAKDLDRRYADILAGHYTDPVHRQALFRAYAAFQTVKGDRVAAEWLRRAPNSAFAQLARGDAAIGAATRVRGGAVVDETTDAQFAAMDAQLRLAVPLLRAALHAEPRLSPACVDLMQAGNLTGASELKAVATRHCMRIDPLSFEVNRMWLMEVDPRWGGSFQALERAVAEVRRREPQSPMLASLLSKAIGRSALLRLDDPSSLLPIAAELDRAALTSPDPYYIDKVGEAAEQAHDYVKARLYFDQALRFAPDDVDLLVDRARLLARGDDVVGALADVHRAEAQVDDCGCRNDAGIAEILISMHRFGEARAPLRRAMLRPEQRKWAMTRLCQTYFMRGFDRAGGLACTRQLVEAFPDDSGALYLRALALYIVHDPTARDADARFRQQADMDSDVIRGEIAQLDQLARPQPQQVVSPQASQRRPAKRG